MLSDEEKEALKILNNTEWEGFMITIKNLIEKQSKEIEELKLKIGDEKTFIQLGECIGEKKVKDKIKAKIEEINKVLNKDIYVIDGHYDDRYYRYLQDKKVLQSLLEKE